MTTLKSRKFVSLLLAVAFATAPLLVAASADAASGLFRMKRTWWGGTSPAESPDPYISTDFHPRLRGKNKAPPAKAYVGTTTVSGRPAPRFTAPGKFIVDYTWTSMCPPGNCSPGYPAFSVKYSYWNMPGRFQPNNSRYGGASQPTTVVFPTTMGNPTPPFNQGNPVTPTTTPCVGGGLVGCGYLAHDLPVGGSPNGGGRKAGEPIRFVDGNYDFSRAGSIMITPGKNRFGGTMHFFYGPNHIYYQKTTINYPYISKAYGPQMDVRDPAADTELGDVQYGGPFNVYRMTTYGYNRTTTGTPYSPGGFYKILAPYFYTLAPFTTGTVTAWQVSAGVTTEFTLMGYDNRTSMGLSGRISMVRPRLVHAYRVPHDPNEQIRMTSASASAWQMDFFFLPEPAGTAMLGSGFVALAILYRRRRLSRV